MTYQLSLLIRKRYNMLMATGDSQHQHSPQLTRPSRLSMSGNLPSLSSIISYAFILFLIFAFFSGLTMRFYASILFFFYGFINRMWISVICLGIFQTLLLIPFRIIKLYRSNHIKEFVDNIEEIKNKSEQQYQFRQHTRKGTKTILFYSVDFFVQLVSYTSIGRLFLTDFYNKPLNPDYLYSFVPYPEYPIQDRFFKIPYPYFTNTYDLGMKWVYFAWIAIFVLLIAFRIAKYVAGRYKDMGSKQVDSLRSAYKTISGQFLLLFLVSWLLLRNVPIDWKIGIFSGDVALQNTKFNTITAIVTFATLLWFGINNIYNKSKIARATGISEDVIDKTEQELFKSSLFNSALIGVGAFLITNQIPSAFELSIFTLEIISLLSPLTLDKLILRSKLSTVKPTQAPSEETKPETKSDE